ncbi:B12-binding domain-containing radical SAM protein [Rheinheimera sp. UJ63]|uniref:B12-binding domain-containing radical SAM protein n=1 Tax=Rheinheimera sp. UJ63 TaxID=2910157 RepID=UPI001F32B710|nr:radical SAM protein [Rheinheimera sp. UJ63]MCF4008057.1 radical SAM protein [Rheinheimera sp. UJ63]
MYLNSNLMILQRNNYLMVSDLSGSVRPTVVHDLDIVLLSLCLQYADKMSICQGFISHPLVKSLSPHIKTESVLQRLEQLAQANLFHSEPPSKSKITTTHDVLISLNKTANQIDLNIPKTLAISMHFAVVITEEGFLSWCSFKQAMLKLSVLHIILLSAFADGKTFEDVKLEKLKYFENESHFLENVLELYEARLLIRKKELKEFQQTSIPVFNIANTSNQQIAGWQDIEPDGRIPVYFVPHMENHFPLALGVLFSAIQHYQDGKHLQRFVLIPITFLEPQALLTGPYQRFGAGVWLFSNYMWSIDLNMQISNTIKQHNSINITIHGGPSTPDYPHACQDFFVKNSSVDIAVHGEGEVAISEIFETITKINKSVFTYNDYQLSNVTGISFKSILSKKVVHTAKRERMKEVDLVPSPYLSGYFDSYGGRVESAIIETNRGCPYGCTFCDWGSATNQKVRKFALERVMKEIDWISKNKINVLWIADANFGMYERDIEIAKYIVTAKEKYGYPNEVVVNYTKNSTLKLVEIIKIFTNGNIISQGIISIQTTDENTLGVINRRNIKTERYDELTQIFSDLNLPLSTDLMIGLPGITTTAFLHDLQRYIDLDVSVKAYPTQLLPNSPMADPEYIKKYNINVDENDFVISSFSFTEQDLVEMKAIYRIYVMADGYSLLRYVMRFLQWEYRVPAMTFLTDLRDQVIKDPKLYSNITWAVRFFEHDKTMPGGWTLFYQQIAAFITNKYGIANDSALSTVLQVSILSMPDDCLTYPVRAMLQHDFVKYFKEFKSSKKSLKQYSSAEFQVSDPNSMVSVDMNYMQYDTHQFFWELQSAVARPKSISDFTKSNVVLN